MKNTLIDVENYFDQAEALHTVLSLYHEGMSSKKYALLCKSKFKPAPMWSESDVILENYFYNEIVEYSDDELEQLMDEINEHIDNRD